MFMKRRICSMFIAAVLLLASVDLTAFAQISTAEELNHAEETKSVETTNLQTEEDSKELTKEDFSEEKEEVSAYRGFYRRQ